MTLVDDADESTGLEWQNVKSDCGGESDFEDGDY